MYEKGQPTFCGCNDNIVTMQNEHEDCYKTTNKHGGRGGIIKVLVKKQSRNQQHRKI
jgi:hypothetical protein